MNANLLTSGVWGASAPQWVPRAKPLVGFPTRCERDAYVLRRNIYRYFPAVDHAILNPKPDGETVSSDEPATPGLRRLLALPQ